MTQIDRRAVLGGIALAGGALAAGNVQAAPTILAMNDLKKEAEVACLYHCDFGDVARFGQMLTNIGNHYSAYGADPFAVQIAVVAHGGGVKFFMEKLDTTLWKDEAAAVLPLYDRVNDLSKNGLQVYLCDITFERLKLDRAHARVAPFIAFVPSGVATVGTLQAKGFGYLKVG